MNTTDMKGRNLSNLYCSIISSNDIVLPSLYLIFLIGKFAEGKVFKNKHVSYNQQSLGYLVINIGFSQILGFSLTFLPLNKRKPITRPNDIDPFMS